MEKKRINNIIILSVLLLVILGVGGLCGSIRQRKGTIWKDYRFYF